MNINIFFWLVVYEKWNAHLKIVTHKKKCYEKLRSEPLNNSKTCEKSKWRSKESEKCWRWSFKKNLRAIFKQINEMDMIWIFNFFFASFLLSLMKWLLTLFLAPHVICFTVVTMREFIQRNLCHVVEPSFMFLYSSPLSIPLFNLCRFLFR